MHARRLVRDHERLPESSEAMINLAAIRLMTRRLTRPSIYPAAGRPRYGEGAQSGLTEPVLLLFFLFLRVVLPGASTCSKTLRLNV